MRIKHIIRDKSTSMRVCELGVIGEKIAEQLLRKNGFTKVANLNSSNLNFHYADLVAWKNGKRYAISVKMRNKYERSGKLNSRYKLGKNAHKLALKAEKILKAKAAWIAISLEPKTYCAYFGLLSDLSGNQLGISMTNTAVQNYKCLAFSKPHNLKYSKLENKYKVIKKNEGV